jgi:hypothetical protein
MLAAIFLASQWHFLANKHAVLAGCSAFTVAPLSGLSVKAYFPSGKFSTERKFCEMWLADTNFEVENFQLLTMLFSENFLSVEIFLEWKWAFTEFEFELNLNLHEKVRKDKFHFGNFNTQTAKEVYWLSRSKTWIQGVTKKRKLYTLFINGCRLQIL